MWTEGGERERERGIKVACDWLELPVSSSVFRGVPYPTHGPLPMFSRPTCPKPIWGIKCRIVCGDRFSGVNAWKRPLRMASDCTGMVSSRTHQFDIYIYIYNIHICIKGGIAVNYGFRDGFFYTTTRTAVFFIRHAVCMLAHRQRRRLHTIKLQRLCQACCRRRHASGLPTSHCHPCAGSGGCWARM